MKMLLNAVKDEESPVFSEEKRDEKDEKGKKGKRDRRQKESPSSLALGRLKNIYLSIT